MPDYYGTVIDSDIYFAKLYGHNEWKNASDDDKLLCLYEATQHIDTLNYWGCKTDPTQTLQFPRGGDVAVPVLIEQATYEEAYQIICGNNNEDELASLRVKKYEFGNVSTEYMPGVNPTPNVTAGILSSKAWRWLIPYLRRAEDLKLVRV